MMMRSISRIMLSVPVAAISRPIATASGPAVTVGKFSRIAAVSISMMNFISENFY